MLPTPTEPELLFAKLFTTFCTTTCWLGVKRGESAETGGSQPLNHNVGGWNQSAPWKKPTHTHTVPTIHSANQGSSPAAHYTQAPQQGGIPSSWIKEMPGLLR